jgi:hypothetical protein
MLLAYVGPETMMPIASVIAVIAGIGLLWVLPIVLGVRLARRKGYSPAWMWFGIHPIGGWIAYIVFLALPARMQCINCGGFVATYFKLCPYCHEPVRPAVKKPLDFE